MNKPDISEKRFSMIKNRHSKTLEDAIKSNKIDQQMIDLCKLINSTEDYFTSSSCAGRIMLLDVVGDENKKDSKFHAKWHRKISLQELKIELAKRSKGVLWLRVEPFIIHIGCKNLEKAKKILEVKNKAGIKRGGIIFAEEGKYLLELTGTQFVSLPLVKDNKILVDENYLSYLIEISNKKISQNYKRLEKFYNAFKGVINEH
ncbi:MAG: hypothetical protein N3D73_01310 [Candidatus Diapherotrites archaeon]|nr:hypothetical protein [Candidatus Diapherotrites archaeon]